MGFSPLGHNSPDTVTAFHEQGVAVLGPALLPDQLEAVLASVDAIASEHGVVGDYACIVHDAWRRSPALAALVQQVGSLACEAVGAPALVLFHDHVLVKPPGGADMAWHQDYSYLPLDRAEGLTLWIALDDVGDSNGCLYYLPRSHTTGELRAAWGLTGEDDPRATLPPIEVAPSVPGIPVPVAAGSAIAHHTYVLHRSPRNASDRPRRAWALSFVTPDARWSPCHSPHPRSTLTPRKQGEALESDLPRVYRRRPC
jgi:ectoine hydroxylase-related dioxygenase (phytanoyl-CoA dioxygenase family)